MLFGVAGGMARYFNLDPSIVRIVWALLVLAGGAGLLLYVVAAIVIPEAPLGAPEGTVHGAAAPADAGSAASAGGATPAWGYRAGVERRERGGGAVLLGLFLVLLGGWFLLQRFLPSIDADVVWPVVILLLGGALVVGALRR